MPSTSFPVACAKQQLSTQYGQNIVVLLKKSAWDDRSFVTWVRYAAKSSQWKICIQWSKREGHGQQQYFVAVVLKWSSVGIKSQKNPLHHCTTTNSLICYYKSGWIHPFMSFASNSDIPIQRREQKRSDHTCFSLFLLHEPFLLLFLAEAVAHKGIFSCCSPSASWVDVMCIQRCFYAHLGCHMWLFELLAWSTLTILFWPLPPTRHFRPLNGHFLFFELFTAKHRNDCVGKSQEISNC